MGTSSAMSRRNLNTSVAEKTNESSSSLSPGCCHVLNSASKDWNSELERMMSSAWEGWKDLRSEEKQPSRSSGAVKLWNRIWTEQQYIHNITVSTLLSFPDVGLGI